MVISQRSQVGGPPSEACAYLSTTLLQRPHTSDKDSRLLKKLTVGYQFEILFEKSDRCTIDARSTNISAWGHHSVRGAGMRVVSQDRRVRIH